MNLRLIRHAESTANVEDRWQGRVDFPLSVNGRLQADRLRSRLEREEYVPSRIYTSPLSRASETARVISSNWDRSLESWDDLTEIDVGILSGLRVAEAVERFPEVARNVASTRDFDLVNGAETYRDRTSRAQRVVNRLVSEHHNADRVLVITHGGIMIDILAQLLGTNRLWFLKIQNTAMFEFSVDVDSWHLAGRTRTNANFWRIDRFNDASHLGED